MSSSSMIRREPSLLGADTLSGRLTQQLFDSFYRSPLREAGDYPEVDLYDKGDALVLEAELPGYHRDGVDIRIDNDVLTITGERPRSLNGGSQPRYLTMERRVFSFQRSFVLPISVVADQVEAVYRDGLLTITMPKVDSAIPKSIPIKMS